MADKDPGYSAFIKAVAGDGTSPPDVRVLSGWLGASGEEGHVRLYLDSSLSTYVDIPGDAILYSEEIANSHPAGQRTVWVKSDADLKEGGSAITRAAKFLFGQVQQDFLGGVPSAPGAAQQAGAARQRPDAQATQLCLTYKPGCERTGITGDCESNLVPCGGPGPGRPFTQLSCSAIGACGSNVCAVAAARTDSMMGCFDAPRGPSMTDVCPQTQSGHQCHTNCCRISDFVQAQAQAAPTTQICITPTLANCITSHGCHATMFGCHPQTRFCNSAVDACPSSLGCTFACDPTIFQQQQQFVGAANKPVLLPGPGTSSLCITDNCQTPILKCTPASTPDPCATALPALCQPRVAVQQQPGMVTITCFTCFGCHGGDVAQNCVGQTFQTGHTCPCPPATGIQCQPVQTQQNCPPVSQHPPQCCFGQTFQTGIAGCNNYGAAQNCVGQTFQTGHTCPCPPATGVQCQPWATEQNCPPPSPPPRCCVGQTFHTGIQGCDNAQALASGPGWTCLGCNQGTHYPQCNSHVGVCATRPPCF
ncbi:MAG TPA: hypothetical protein VN181_13125 [Thermoanaerobaculia bacterium]|nr:hypothetical protein [Thermoanaerobaculia bacterium]